MRAAAERLDLDVTTLGWEIDALAASRSLDAPVLGGLIAAVRERAARTSGERACAMDRD